MGKVAAPTCVISINNPFSSQFVCKCAIELLFCIKYVSILPLPGFDN